MFKKTLAAAAILAAFGSAAYAADVQLYGRIDLGLQYTHADQDVKGQDSTDTFEMSSGAYTSNRIGLRGTEELGNGWDVKFVLENGFKGDSGELSTGGSIFDREATLQLTSDKFGTFGFGRMTQIAMDAGSFGIGGGWTPFGTGWGDVGNMNMLWGAGVSSRWSNMVAYRTPSFAGFQVTAQYSFGDNTYTDDHDVVHEEGKSSSDRYYGIGATYSIGGLNLAAVVDSVNNNTAHAPDAHNLNVEDTVRVIVGGSYDFGVVKPYLAAAYVKDGKLNDFGSGYDGLLNTLNGYYWDTWSVALGADVPAFGGTFHGVVGYMDGDADTSQDRSKADPDVDFSRWMVGVGYDYKLSKRTTVYGVVGYMRDKVDPGSKSKETIDDRDPSEAQVSIGMAHYF